jgi:hypothetical protein
MSQLCRSIPNSNTVEYAYCTVLQCYRVPALYILVETCHTLSICIVQVHTRFMVMFAAPLRNQSVFSLVPVWVAQVLP